MIKPNAERETWLFLFTPGLISKVAGGTVVDQNKIGQSKFRLCNSIFLRNPSLRKQKCQK
jgi:hypothetical protein